MGQRRWGSLGAVSCFEEFVGERFDYGIRGAEAEYAVL